MQRRSASIPRKRPRAEAEAPCGVKAGTARHPPSLGDKICFGLHQTRNHYLLSTTRPEYSVSSGRKDAAPKSVSPALIPTLNSPCFRTKVGFGKSNFFRGQRTNSGLPTDGNEKLKAEGPRGLASVAHSCDSGMPSVGANDSVPTHGQLESTTWYHHGQIWWQTLP